MTNDKDATSGFRTTRESEIFPRTPRQWQLQQQHSGPRKALNYSAATVE